MSIPGVSLNFLIIMATLSLTIFKAKALKDGRHKIRIALRHKHETTYIVTRFIISENQFKNGQVVKHPEASAINRKLRNILDVWGIERSGFFNGREKWAKGFENQRV